ncbi:DIS3-like exonuclease 2 [Boothiomyces sp. JEL0866]|nr:DIS3-like exonuclease 2 [Boothiomyces sp. JEL0866]
MKTFDFNDFEEQLEEIELLQESQIPQERQEDIHIGVKPKSCRMFKRGRCKFKNCKFSHESPGIPFLQDCLITKDQAMEIVKKDKSVKIVDGKSKGNLVNQNDVIKRNLPETNIENSMKDRQNGTIKVVSTKGERIIVAKKSHSSISETFNTNTDIDIPHTPKKPKSKNIDETPKKATPKNFSKNNHQDSPKTPRRRANFDPHFTKEQVEEGLLNGSLLEGVLRISKKNRYDAYVKIDGSDNDIFIHGLKNQNRALNDDVVIVKLLEGEELKKEKEKVLKKQLENQKRSQDRQQKVDIFKIDYDEEITDETRTFGTVVAIVSSELYTQTHVGVMYLNQPLSDKVEQDSKFVWFKPNDIRIPWILIPKQIVPSEFLKSPESFSDKLVTCKITHWKITNQYPSGEYTGVLGQIGELPTESKALLVSAGVTWELFSDAVLDSLSVSAIKQEEYEKRENITSYRIFSIDPPTARDLDDALSCKALPDGNFEIGVHIADVSYFVDRNSPIDQEAFHRATSVYLTQKVIPMLPRVLCEELCSLNAGVDRLAFSVFWIFDPDGKIIGEPRFSRTIINSCAKLSYQHAQCVLENQDMNTVSPVEIIGHDQKDVENDILQLYKFSKILRQKRYDNGALTLNSIKLWFDLDDAGNPLDCGIYELKDANRLIEEFMLLANMAVAHKISNHFPETSLLRRHPPPLEKALDQVKSQLEKEGIPLDITSAQTLNESLDAISDPTIQFICRLMTIKGMKRASYFCTGAADINQFSHYALSVPLYTHFTSPIRRYCDLIVHRLLECCLNDLECPYDTSTIDRIATQCNLRKNASKDAQDASQHLYLCVLLSQLKGPIVEEAIICQIGSRSFDVVVPRYGIEQRVYVEDSVDLGQAVGCESLQEDRKLAIYWKKDGVHTDNMSNCLKQVVKLFDTVKVLITVDMSKSPPVQKLYARPP